MKTTLTDFQRGFRRAREAADRGESVLIEAEGGAYVFEKAGVARSPFAGLEGVFGVVALPKSSGTDRVKIRTRLHAKTRSR